MGLGFFWKCPKCHVESYYSGSKTTDAITTCKACSAKLRIWKHKVVEKTTPKPQITTKNHTKIIEEDLSFGADFNRPVIIEGLNDTIRIYKNSYVTREGSRVSKKNAAEGKKVLEWVERYENQLSVPLLVTYHPYFVKVLAAYQELKKLRG